MPEEMFDLYDEAGRRVGLASRRECHGNPALLHHTSHVVVFSPGGGALLLQKRSADKDIQPGKWDTAVGGHLKPGEDFLAGAKRELAEELGVTGEVELEFLFDAQIRNVIESEDTRVFGTTLAGPFQFQREEIDEVRFWSFAELRDVRNHSSFTPNLVTELARLAAAGRLGDE
ncbi:MAG: NUDIX domain-containing protein [Victivallaceae bacterium]|nr:NUDIX domain-containing protein [Victivallaceae bacterium]